MSYTIVYGIVLGAVFVGILAAGLCVYVLVEAVRDRAAIRRARIGNGRRLVANRAVKAEAARTWATVILVLGAILLLAGERNRGPISQRPDVAIGAAATLIAYHTAVLVLALDAVSALTARRRLDRDLAAGHRSRAAEARDGSDLEEDDHAV